MLASDELVACSHARASRAPAALLSLSSKWPAQLAGPLRTPSLAHSLNPPAQESRAAPMLLPPKLMAAHMPPSEFSEFIWRNCAPPRAKFFIWLLVHDAYRAAAISSRNPLSLMPHASCGTARWKRQTISSSTASERVFIEDLCCISHFFLNSFTSQGKEEGT